MLKTKLWFKLMLSFAVVIGLGSIIAAFSINRATYTAFSNMVRQGDIVVAEELAETLAILYKEKGSWQNADEIVLKPYQHIYIQGRIMGSMGRNLERGRGMGQQIGSTHIVVTDKKGSVILSTGEYKPGSVIPVDKGIPIQIAEESKVVGYVFVGSMIGAGLLPFQEEFLKSSTKAIFFSLFSMILIAVAVGYFLIRHITFPVKKLTFASKSVAAGNLDTEVLISQNDELGELSKSFNLMTESLRRAEEWKKQIIADAAHELRTPVSLIQGRLEMMIEGVYPVDAEGIKIVYEETLMLTNLIKELSELSNAEAGTVSLRKEKMSIRNVLEYAKEYFLPSAEEKSITLELVIPDPVPELDMDIQKMNQVLGNLLSNALRYTPDGGKIRLSSRYIKEENIVLICVEDTGQGIPEGERGKIFDRFYRVDSHRNRETGGSGLGLAISREIIRLHGGTISAKEESSLGGAKITISLPVMD